MNVNGLAGIQIHGWNNLVDNLQVQDSSYKGSPLGMTLIAWWMVPIPIAQKTLRACVVSNHYNWKLNKGLIHMYRNTNMCIFVFFNVYIYTYIYTDIHVYVYVLLGAWASLCWVSVKQILAIRTIYIKLSELYIKCFRTIYIYNHQNYKTHFGVAGPLT